MEKRAVIFDLDGTLIDSGAEGLRRILRVAASRNLSVTQGIETKLKNMWGKPAVQLISACWPDDDSHAFHSVWEELDNREPIPLFPGTLEALHELRLRGLWLGVFTSRRRKTASVQIGKNGLTSFFGKIQTVEDSPHKKPDPKSIEPTLTRLNQLGIRRGEILYVGDTVEADWNLAKAAGLDFVGVLSGGIFTRDNFRAAGLDDKYILNSVADLPAIIK